jgi:hypothetical protein
MYFALELAIVLVSAPWSKHNRRLRRTQIATPFRASARTVLRRYCHQLVPR